MKKNLLLTGLLLLLCMSSKAQFPLVTIDSIQTPINLAACNDSSVLIGDTVRVRGIVVMDGGLAQASGGRNIWIQQKGGGAWNGLDIYGAFGLSTSPDDILDLVAGDSVEITGDIQNFDGESEIQPLTSGTGVQILGSGHSVNSTLINLGDLNDNTQTNILTTGEQWEGVFCEVQNVTVVSVDFFSGGNRVSFVVTDASGNRMGVSDRFIVQRLPANGGTFVAPNIGDTYCSIKGVIAHSANGCLGATGGNSNRGYEMYPFDTSHYAICAAAPSISNLARNYVSPPCTTDVTISAEITDGNGVASATMYYAIGAANPTYTPVSMSNTVGNTYTADIPGQTDGTFVKYYVCATDSASNTSCIPNVPGTEDPRFYTVRCNGLTIYDVQYVPNTFNNAASGYVNMQVTVEGVVTASAQSNNLGFVFIQQESQLDWAGIMLLGSTSLTTLKIGDKVTVTGTVEEDFGYTRIENVSSVSINGTGTINPLGLSPDIFTTYDFATNEAYEGMLISYVNSGGNLFVVDENPDSPGNFAEYRVGTDQFDPATGGRIQAGRQTGSAFSSLNVSYVNDSSWATTDGIMNVPICLVTNGMQFDTITGVMMYSFGEWKMLARNNDDFDGSNPPCLLSVEEDLESASFVAYPNPTSEMLHLNYDATALGGNVNAVIFDLLGREIQREALNNISGRAKLDMSTLQNGTYVLMVMNDRGERLFTQKIILTK